MFLYTYYLIEREVMDIKIYDISMDIAEICIHYYISLSRSGNNYIKNINIDKMRKYISFNITTFFEMRYTDNPDIESIDVSSSLISKRFEIINNNDYTGLPEYIVKDAINILTENHSIFGFIDDDFISINVVPFDGFTLSGENIIAIINNYIY